MEAGVEHWFRMGGYAAYVWPAFAATLFVLGALLASSIRTLRAREATLAELLRKQGGDRSARRARDKAAAEEENA